MSGEPFDPSKDGALTDFTSRMSYGDYLGAHISVTVHLIDWYVDSM